MLYMLAILLVVLSWNSVPGVVFSFAVGGSSAWCSVSP